MYLIYQDIYLHIFKQLKQLFDKKLFFFRKFELDALLILKKLVIV
jgi:hypothetical protein